MSDSYTSSQSQTVEICFHDPAITEVFAALLKSRGVVPSVLKSPSHSNTELPVVTEPHYIEQFGGLLERRALVVGGKATLPSKNHLILCQPLTVHKIERALASFLAGG